MFVTRKPDEDKDSGFPSGLNSVIAALKGRPSSSGQDEEPHDPITTPPAHNNEPPVVTVVQPTRAELFPVSADMPENKIRKELQESRAQTAALEQALVIANKTIADLSGQVGAANARIAELLMERTQGVEDIIAGLRKFQADGAKPGLVGTTGSGLNSIFSMNAKLIQGIDQASFNARLENDLRLALETMRAASGDAFSFSIETAERADFDTGRSNTKVPAKMMIVDLKKKSGATTAKNDKKIVIIAFENKIAYLAEDEFRVQFDRKVAFLNPVPDYSKGIFKGKGQTVVYDHHSQINTDLPAMNGGFSLIPPFIDEFVSRCLPSVVTSNEFDRAARSLKAMDLVP